LDERKLVRVADICTAGANRSKNMPYVCEIHDGLNIVESRIEGSANLKSILPALCDLEHSATNTRFTETEGIPDWQRAAID